MVERSRVNGHAGTQLRARSWEGYRVLYDLVQQLSDKVFTLPIIRERDGRFKEGGVFESVVPDLLLLGVLGSARKELGALRFISRLPAPSCDSRDIPCTAARGLRKTVSASVANNGEIVAKKRGITPESVEKIKALWTKTGSADVVAEQHVQDLGVTTSRTACRILRAAAKPPNSYLFELPGVPKPTFRWIRNPITGEVLS